MSTTDNPEPYGTLDQSFEYIWNEGIDIHGQAHAIIHKPLRLINREDLARVREGELALLRTKGGKFLVHRLGQTITLYAVVGTLPVPP